MNNSKAHFVQGDFFPFLHTCLSQEEKKSWVSCKIRERVIGLGGRVYEISWLSSFYSVHWRCFCIYVKEVIRYSVNNVHHFLFDFNVSSIVRLWFIPSVLWLLFQAVVSAYCLAQWHTDMQIAHRFPFKCEKYFVCFIQIFLIRSLWIVEE